MASLAERGRLTVSCGQLVTRSSAHLVAEAQGGVRGNGRVRVRSRARRCVRNTAPSRHGSSHGEKFNLLSCAAYLDYDGQYSRADWGRGAPGLADVWSQIASLGEGGMCSTPREGNVNGPDESSKESGVWRHTRGAVIFGYGGRRMARAGELRALTNHVASSQMQESRER